MNNDLISVIVPVYNIEKYIEKTVYSICRQTYSNLQIILVDDGSTDNSPEILDRLSIKDNRISVIHKTNGGVTSARFAGIKEAIGKWTSFIDGDDIIEPEMYERLFANADKYNADISHCGYQMVFPDRTDYYYNTGKIIKQDRHEALKALLEGAYIEPSLGNKLIKTELLKTFYNSEKMDMTIKNNEDLLMNFYLFKLAKIIIYEDFCPYHYMVRKNSAATSSLNENKLRDPLKVQKILYSETENDTELNDIVKRRILMILINISIMPQKQNSQLIASYKQKAKKELKSMLFSVLKGNYSLKQKILAFWCTVWADSYGVVHKVYSKLSGADKKYEVRKCDEQE